jgi:ribonuclease D
MTTLPQNKPVWVDTPAALQEMLDDLRQYDLLAVDTESNSLYVYQEQVCLIQFSTGKMDYLVDPLAIDDLSALGPIFADPDVEKIFHAAEYDLICLKRDFGFEVNNIFDTMLAGRTLGRTAVGLGSILKEEFDLDIDKRYQRANWGKRPLPPAQLAYARLDTHYLIELRKRLKQELIEQGRWELAEEDFRRMTNVSVPMVEPHNVNCLRISGTRDLSPAQMAVLQQLCEYRDQQARESNLPPFKIMGNQVMVDLAEMLPRNKKELEHVKGMTPGQVQRHGQALLRAVERGLQSEPIQRGNHHLRPSDAYLNRLENLRNWRRDAGQKIGVPSDVIMPRDRLELIAQENPSGPEALKQVMEDLPWRYKIFGEQILTVLNNHGRGR